MNFIGSSTHNILQNGHIFFYIIYGRTSFTTSYGLCALARIYGRFSLILFNKPGEIFHLYLDDTNYIFYSEISIVPPESITSLKSAIQKLFNNFNKTLLNTLMERDWVDSSINTPFPSLSAFLTFLLSLPISDEVIINELLNKGAKLFVRNDLLVENFIISCHSSENSVELVISLQLPKEYTNYLSYSIVFFLNNLQQCKKVKSNKLINSEVKQLLQKEFVQILKLRCTQVIDYIFDAKNKLLNKSDIHPNVIHIAAIHSSPEIFEYILTDFENWEITNENSDNLLHSCISHEMFENLYILIKKIPLPTLNNLLFAKNVQHITPFNAMMQKPNAQLSIEVAINKGCHDKNGNNFIHLAIMNKNWSFLELILKTKFEDSLFSHRNNLGQTPIQLAIQKQDLKAVLILLKYSTVSLSSQDRDGCNSLHTAIIYYEHKIFESLMKLVIDFDRNHSIENKLINSRIKLNSPISGNSALTPVLLSIRENQFQATELLLSIGARIDLEDRNNQSIPYYIHSYCQNPDYIKRVLQIKIVKENLPKLVEPCTEVQDMEYAADPLIFYFYKFCSFEKLNMFFNAFSDRNIIKHNREGNTILLLTLKNNEDSLSEYLLQRFGGVHSKLISDFINTKNKIGETALFISVKESKLNISNVLLRMGASVDIEYPGGNTILHTAINTRNKEIVQILLGHPKIGQLYCKANDRDETPIISLMKIDGIGAFDAINRDKGTSLRGPNGESILHLVVKNGDKDTLVAILKEESVKSLFTVRDNEGQTPLHYAVISIKTYAITLLVQHGLSISEPDNMNKTPIHYAIDGKNVDVWKAIMSILSKHQKVHDLIDQKSPSGLTLLQQSIECNFLIAVQDILTLRPNLCPVHPENNSIVHLAAKSSERAEILKYILDYIKKESLSDEKLKSLFHSNNLEQLPPLHYAVYNNNIEGVKLILNQGISIVASFKRELSFFSGKLGDKLILCQKVYSKPIYLFGYRIKSTNETALILTEIPSLQSTEIFQENSVTKVTSITEDTIPLFLQTSCSDVIHYLIYHKIIKYTFSNRATLLHYAAQYSSQHILLYLISSHSLSPTALDTQNNSLLYYALQNKNLDVLREVSELLHSEENKKQKNLFEIPNSKGKRILGICLEFNNLEGFTIILPYISDLIYQNVNKLTLLHLIVQNDQGEHFITPFIDFLTERYNQEDLSEYANTTATSDKLTALHRSIQSNNVKIVSSVLRLNPDLSITTFEEYNAIHLASSTGNVSIIQLLLEKDKLSEHNLVNSKTMDKTQLTPLHISVCHCDNNIFQLLLKYKARPEIVNAYGQTSLHYVVSYPKFPEETLKLILTTLLQYPVLLSKQDNSGHTPVFCSITHCNLTALTTFLEQPTNIDFSQTDKNGKNLLRLSIECKNHEIWKILFDYLKKRDYFSIKSICNLIDSISLCMESNNETAFGDLLGLNPHISISESNWRKLIEISILKVDNNFYLTNIILHLKKNQPNSWKDIYFYPQSNDFTPPLQLAIQKGNIKAIEMMISEKISLSFLTGNNQLSLHSQADPKSLVICKKIKNPSLLLIGYKISISRTDYKYTLVGLPQLDNTKLYLSSEISVLQNLNNEYIITILRSPCVEPINRVILPSYTLQLEGGCELIHLAARYGSSEIIEHWLLKQDVTKLDENKNSILYYALLHQTASIFQTICNHMVRINSYNLFNIQNVIGNRILDICIKRNDFSSFSLLLESKYKVELDYVDSKGYNLFHRIILLRTDVSFYKKLHSVFLSNERYTNLIGKCAGPSNLTPLHLAIVQDLQEYIVFMLENRYDLCVKSKCGNLPLHLAILYNFDEAILNMILNAIPNDELSNNLNAQNNQGYTPLHLATQNGNTIIIKVLLAKGYIRKEIVDKLLRTTLHHAVLLREEEFSPELVHLLLQDTDLHKYKDKEGRTPVHYCINKSNLRALEAMFKLKKEIDINDTDNVGKNIFHFAIENKVIPIWNRIFTELKASHHYQSIIEETLDDKTLLVYCIIHNNLTAFRDILSLTPNILTTDFQNITPLHHAGESPKRSEMLILLKEFIEKSQEERIKEIFCFQNEDNLTPLHCAIKNNNLTAITTLLQSSPFVFLNKQRQFTLCALNSSLLLKLCKRINNGNLMIGYKVVLDKITCWVLTTIPDMRSEAILFKDSEIIEITKFDLMDLQTVLKYPSSEPLMAFLKSNLISKNDNITDKTTSNTYCLLHYAAMHGSIEVVTELCNMMNIFSPDSNGDSVLLYALNNSISSIFEFLINKIIELNKNKPPGVDLLNATNKSGKRLLEVALEIDKFDAFTILLKVEFKIELAYKDANGCTLLHKIVNHPKDAKYLTDLLSEIGRREPNSTLCTYVNYYIPETLNTALHLCISKNQEECLRSLLKFSPNLSCEDSEGNSPLHLASKYNFKSLIKILIDYVREIGGDLPSFINAVNIQKLTPLHFSIIHFNSDIVRLLLTERANLYAVNQSGQSVLHLAVEIKFVESKQAIQFLLDYERENPNPDNNLIRVKDNSNQTPLHVAVISNKIEATELLLAENPDLTIADKDQMTVLHYSIRKDSSTIFCKILEVISPNNTTDPLHVLNLKDKNGDTAINKAIDLGAETSIAALLKLNPLLNLKNNSGQTPLHLAVSKPVNILDCILEKIKSSFQAEMITYLNATNSDGLPPLHLAILGNRLESVQKLLDFGATLSYTDETGFTTLYNGKGGLSLSFVKAQINRFRSLISKDTLLVGYRMDSKERWIVSNLPELDKTTVIANSDIEEFTKHTLKEGIVINIVNCACTEPIEVAIQNNLVNIERKEGNGKWLNYLASKKGHKNVIKYLCNNLPIEDLCAMVRNGVTNTFDAFEATLDFIPTQHSYQKIPRLPDNSNDEEKLIYNISTTLCETMRLSLENIPIHALTKLLSLNPCLNFLYPEGNDTLLHLIIIENKSSDFLKIFLNKIIEIEPGNQEVVTVNGVRIIDAKNKSSMTALSLSIQMKQEENIKMLLNYKPDLSLCDDLKNSILHFAAKTSNDVIVGLIIADILDSPNLNYLFSSANSDGCIPLHIATETEHLAICEQLLTNGSEFYSRDVALRSILHHAILIQTEFGKSMTGLILNNAKNDKNSNNIVSLEDKEGQLPIHYAVVQKCLASLELLISHTSTIKHKDAKGQTILHLATIHGNTNTNIISCILTEILNQEESNANSEWVTDRVINFQDNCQKTALHLSIDNQNHACLKEILKAKPNLELVDAEGNTSLHTAVEVNDTCYLKSILDEIPLESLSNFFTRLNYLGLPPLQYAITKNNFLAAEILVNMKATLAFQSDGKTRIRGENGKFTFEIVPYNHQCWAGFRISHFNRESLVITELSDLKNTIFLKDANSIKPYCKLNTQNIKQISECQSCDPLNYAIQIGLIAANTKLDDGLHVATLIAKHGNKEVVKRFYEIPKDTLYFEKSGNSMIESAVANSNIESLDLLLSFLPSSLQPTEPQSQEISSCVKNSLKLSLKNPNTSALNALLSYSNKVNYLYTQDKLTLLHLAIQEQRSTDLLNAIFTKVNAEGTESVFENVLFINKQSETGKQTALHTCINLKKKDTLDVLLANSPNIFLCDVDGNTALHFAVLHTQDLKFVESLHGFAQDKQKLLNIRNNKGYSALHLAVIGGNLEIVNFLLLSNAEFYPQKSKEPTLLHLAIKLQNDSSRGDVIAALLPYKQQENNQCEITQLRDDFGYPPLHLAVRLRTKNAVKLLLDADPSVLFLKNEDGHTPLHLSIIPQQVASGTKFPYCEVIFNEVLGVIMSCSGVEVCSTCQVNTVICTQDNLKRTAMHYAIQYNNVGALTTLLEKKTCLNVPDQDGNILLHEAVKNINDISCLVLVTEELKLRYRVDNFLDCLKF